MEPGQDGKIQATGSEITEPVRRRLELLQLAETLGSVSEACRRYGISRTRFYHYKRRYSEHGIDGLRDLPPVPRSHPQRISREIEERIVATSLSAPEEGCDRLVKRLRLEGVSVSGPTVQKILNRNDLRTAADRLRRKKKIRRERWLELEAAMAQGKVDLSYEDVALIERHNPCFRERGSEPARPGELLVQAELRLWSLSSGMGGTLHVVIDAHCCYVFGCLCDSGGVIEARKLLETEVLPFYAERSLKMGKHPDEPCSDTLQSRRNKVPYALEG